LLLGAAGAVAGAIAGLAARASSALAAGDDGSIIHVGDDYENVQIFTKLVNTTTTDPLIILTTVSGYAALDAISAGSGYAVQAIGSSSAGVFASGKPGVIAYDGGGQTVPAPTDAGISALSDTGRGGIFKGKLAQIHLAPSSMSTHPSSGQAGDLFLDKSHRLWFCKGGPTWKQIA
jgi:hypothetical protein